MISTESKKSNGKASANSSSDIRVEKTPVHVDERAATLKHYLVRNLPKFLKIKH